MTKTEVWESSFYNLGPVIFDGSTYQMWYSAGDPNKIGYATSEDGQQWVKYGPVLRDGPTGSWDDSFVMRSSVIYDDNEFHMWYGAWNGSSTENRIGHATSLDGVT